MVQITDKNNLLDYSNKKVNGKINICFASDKNYAKFLSLALVSLLRNKSADDDLAIYILDGGLTEADKNKISALKRIADFDLKFVDVDIEKFKYCPVKKHEHISLAAYYRLLIPDFLSEVDKVIYLDCDLLVKNSLKDFYNIDINEYYFAAIPDVDSSRLKKRLSVDEYYNSGVLLLNLNKFRENNFTSKIFDWISEHKDLLKLHDQDVLNLYCNGNIKSLPKIWNAQQKYQEKINDAKILHYVGKYKDDYILFGLADVFKTEYKIELLYTLIQKFLTRIYTAVTKWLFVIRNKDENLKEICFLGFKFYVKRK